MGLIKEYIEEQIEFGLSALANDLFKKAEKKHVEKLINEFKENTNENHFVLKYNRDYTFTIYDKNFKMKYNIKGKVLSFRHHLIFLDKANKKKLGIIKEKPFSLRTLIPIYDNTHDFKLFLKENLIGELKSSLIFWKRKYELSYNDWKVDGSFFEDKYIVKNKDNIEIIKVKYDYKLRSFIIHVSKSEDELLSLMTVLSLNCASVSKKSRIYKDYKYHNTISLWKIVLFILLCLLICFLVFKLT